MEFLSFWTRETFSNIRRNRLMSVLAISTVAVGLFILGMFYVAVMNLRTVAKNQTKKLDIVLVLERDVTPERRREIFNAARVPQAAGVQIVLKAQVLREQQRENPDLPMEDLQGDLNPFGDELRIKLKEDRVDEILTVTRHLDSIKGVQKIRRDNKPVENLLEINRIIYIIGSIALIGLGLAILMIIHNAIRLTVFARRREIQIMELVGATAWFIRIPFLLEGVLYGLIGATVAAGMLSMLYIMTLKSSTGGEGLPLVELLLPLSAQDVLWSCAVVLVSAGLAFGFIGSWISLGRSLGKAEHV